MRTLSPQAHNKMLSHECSSAGLVPLPFQFSCQENFEGALERRDDGVQWVHKVMHRKVGIQILGPNRVFPLLAKASVSHRSSKLNRITALLKRLLTFVCLESKL